MKIAARILLTAGLTVLASCASRPFSVVMGGAGLDRGVGISRVSTGGYIVSGVTSSLGGHGEDSLLVRLDESGNVLWIESFGGSGDDAAWLALESGEGFVVAGFGVQQATDLDCRLWRVSLEGETLWSRSYGGAGRERCWSVVGVEGDGFALVGEVVSADETVQDCLLIRAGENGEERWTRTFDRGLQERCFAVALRDDGGFLLAGQTTPDGGNERDVYLVGTDADGGVEFEHVLGGAGIDLGHGVVTTRGGAVVVGYTAGFGAVDDDPLLIEVTPTGEIAWTRRVAVAGPVRALSAAAVPGGGLCLSGHRRIEGGGQVAFLARTTHGGRLEWSIDLEPFELGYTVTSDRDGSCVLTGHLRGEPEGVLDLFVARVAADGSRSRHTKTTRFDPR